MCSWKSFLITSSFPHLFAGKHFNPFNKSHSDIHDHEEHRHYGDLGNINVDYGDLGNINVGPDGQYLLHKLKINLIIITSFIL